MMTNNFGNRNFMQQANEVRLSMHSKFVYNGGILAQAKNDDKQFWK
jgi:hypothetical protein